MMGSYIVLILFAFIVQGVADEQKTATVGHPFILNTDVTKDPHDIVLWYFNDILIAHVNDISCLYDGEDGIFRNRLMRDCKTGSLIITDVTTQHAGRYEAEIIRSKASGKTEDLNTKPKCDSTKIIRKHRNLGQIIKSFSLTVSGDADEEKTATVGHPFILNTDVTKDPHDIVLWYFNDILIAHVNDISCLYDGEDGIFRNRLMRDCKTGSLIITDVTTQHAGRYEAEIIRSKASGKTEVLNTKPKCDSTTIIRKHRNLGQIIKSFSLTVSASDSDKNKKEVQKAEQEENSDKHPGPSPAVVAGIVIVVVLLVAAAVGVVVIYSRRMRLRNDIKKNIPWLLPKV